jgi:predicted O-methyltransferase YrrM
MDKDFLESIAHLKDDTMGTENLCYVLYGMIKMLKPKNTLELGIGYSTPFILQAIRENTNEFNTIIDNINCGVFDYNSTKNLRFEYYQTPRSYSYTGVDNMSHKNSHSVVEYINKQIDIPYNLHLDDYNTMPRDIKYDFIWMDCGGYADYVNFLDNFTDIFADTTTILLHNTANTAFHNLPRIIEIIELNKTNQNSVGILKYVKSN